MKNCNYYRLCGYALHMKQSSANDLYAEGSSFNEVLDAYSYDIGLRNILLKYIDIIEVRIRTQIAYSFSHACGSYGHYNMINFVSPEECDSFTAALDKAIEKNSEVPFVRNHINKYSNTSCKPPQYNMPLWVAVEILSFSTLSKFYSAIGKDDIKRDIASSLGLNENRLANWLQALACLRNTCAHFGRIFNRDLHPKVAYGEFFYASVKPMTLRTDRIFGYIPIILGLLANDQQRTSFLNDIIALNDEYEEKLDLSYVGFPTDWRQWLQKWNRLVLAIL